MFSSKSILIWSWSQFIKRKISSTLPVVTVTTRLSNTEAKRYSWRRTSLNSSSQLHKCLSIAQLRRMASSQSSGTTQGGAEAATPAVGGVDRSKCVFCRIADGLEKNDIFYQDDDIIVFQDIKPAAKYHLLVVPREHIRDSKTLQASQIGLVNQLTRIGTQVLFEKMKKDDPTTDPESVQTLLGFHWPPFHTVSHLHLHVISPSDQMGFIARQMFKPNSFWFVSPEYVRGRLEKMSVT